jgi:hypothetical protein
VSPQPSTRHLRVTSPRPGDTRVDGYFPPTILSASWSRRQRSWAPATAAWFAGCAGFLAGVVFMYVATWNVPTEHTPAVCLPATAVDYRGDTNMWYNAAGYPLLASEEEDTYERCES